MKTHKLSEGTEFSVPSLRGVFYENGRFCRVPDEVVRKITGKCRDLVENSVYSHARETAGGRVYFATNSKFIRLTAHYPYYKNLGVQMGAGKTGFDVFADGVLIKTLEAEAPDFAKGLEYRAVADTPWSYSWEIELLGAMTDVVVYLPILSELSEIEVVLDGEVQKCTSEPTGAPIVFYGSSITQGGMTSSASKSYVSTLARSLNKDYINLGMWGSCHGEKAMAEYIASLSMSAFVLDYDHNDAAVHPFKERHFEVYETVRRAHESVPILMISRPNNQLGKEATLEMKRAIVENYECAKRSGDENVYFLDGESIMNYSESTDFYSESDKVHPLSAGHAKMAEVIGKALKDIICS